MPKRTDTTTSKFSSYTDSPSEEYKNPMLEKVYHGHLAREKFWEMFRNQRIFKDYNSKDEIQDPRFAYLKHC